MTDDLSAESVRSLLSYNPHTGILKWKQDVGSRAKKGAIAGSSTNKYGHRQIGIKGGRYLVHRVIWLWMTGKWPEELIDHHNGITYDNKWENLRLADKSKNAANSNPHKDNKSGYKGVSRRHNYNKWRARFAKLNEVENVG